MMSGLGALAPVPGRKELSNKDLNLSDDDFDAMLDDMLDSPTKKGSTRPSKQKNQSSNREQTDNTYDMTSIDSSQNSDSFQKRTVVKSATSTNLGFNGKPVNRDLQDHSDILSVDSNNEIFPDQPTDADHLEDSILGSMFKSNRRSMKQAVKPVEVESSSSTLFKSSVNAKDVKKSHGASAASAQPNEIDFDTSMQDDWEGSDSVTSINKVDKPKDDKIGGKTLGKDVATSSLPFAVAQDNEITKGKGNISDFQYGSYSDDEVSDVEEASAYQPSMGRSSTFQTQAPRPPAASHPSSTSPHSAVDGFSLSGMKSIPEGKKILSSESNKDSSVKEIKGGVLANKEVGNKDTDDVDIGFVPSFLEIGKQPRQKRNLGGSFGSSQLSGSVKSKDPEALDELDFALGLGASNKSKLAAVGGTNKIVTDPFLNAGSISSGTSLGGRLAAVEGSRTVALDSSDSEEERPSRTRRGSLSAANSTPALTSALGSAPSLSSPANPSGLSNIFSKVVTEPLVAPVSLTSGALPSLARSPSVQYESSYQLDYEEEDELDVSGIVRKQSFEDFLSEKPSEREKIAESKKPFNGSSNSNSKRESITGMSPSAQRRGSFFDESTRRDKIVSFGVPSPPRIVPSPKNPLRLSIPDATAFTNVNTSPKSLLGSSPSGVFAAQSSSSSSSSAYQIFRLQHSLEEAQLQRDSVERNMRLEVESLKARLVTQTQMDGHGTGTLNGVTQIQMQEMQGEYEKTRSRLMDELNDLRRKVSQLEGEVARHVDEALVQGLKHREEIKYIQDRRDGEVKDAERRKDEEIRCIERRHIEAVAALKQVHLDELQAIKDRNKDSVALNQLAGQIKQSSGSIKLLEESLNARYKGLDVAKEGQMEARERLLSEMEQKARERVEAAEIESYRLKGLLVHMEHVASALRGQGGEETERLRQEHHRLQVMQTSLESERVAVQARAAEETAALRKKARDMEADARRGFEERRAHESRELAERQKLEADRVDFAAHVTSASRAAEVGASQLKDEEARLKRVREDLADQKAQFDRRRQVAQAEIEASEQLRTTITVAKQDLSRERAHLERLAKDLQVASDRLSKNGEQIETAKRGLAEREELLKNGIAHMQSEALALTRREADLRDSGRVMDLHKVKLEDAEKVLTHKRIEAAAIHRSLSGRQAAATITSLLMPTNDSSSQSHGQHQPMHQYHSQTYSGSDSPVPRQHSQSDANGKGHGLVSGGDSGTSNLLSQLRNRGDYASGGTASSQMKVPLSAAEVQQKVLEDQALSSAKQMLSSVRGQLSRSSGARMEMSRVIEEESAFLANTGGKGRKSYE